MKFYSLLFFLFFSSQIFAADSQKTLLSPLAEFALMEMSDTDFRLDSKFKNKYLVETFNNTDYFSLIIKVNPEFNNESISKLGGFINSDLDDIKVIKIPIQKLKSLHSISNIDYIEMNQKVGLLMNRAKTLVGIDRIENEKINNKVYYGTGVLIGLLDLGFDFTHPTFLDADTKKNRINRVWIQHNNSGSSPSGFNYGSELNSSSLNLLGTDYNAESHGTHTAGIAAGSGLGANNLYSGIAPKAELVFVSPNFTDEQSIATGHATILDAIKYAFDYASKVSKPIVVNMSLGMSIGPHDGTSLFDQSLAKLIAPGKIFVNSAGNDAMSKIHSSFTFKSGFTDTLKVLAETTSTGASSESYIDIWGESNAQICVNLGFIESDKSITWNAVNYCNLSNKSNKAYLTSKSGSAGFVNISAKRSEFNGKSRIFLDLSLSDQKSVVIAVTASNGTVHLWNAGQGGSSGNDFLQSPIANIKTGDNQYIVSDLGGNSNSAITIASYMSQSNLLNYHNTSISSISKIANGIIAQYSARGNTVDGRQKPEIAAPGSLIVSSANSFDYSFKSNGSNSSHIIAQTSGTYSGYSYVAMEGTSMSSPVAAGIVALMLEAHPYISTEQVREILKETAINDSFTGNIKEKGDIAWGYGKINAYEAVRMAQTIGSNFNPNPDIKIYPNPSFVDINDGAFTIEFSKGAQGDFYFELLDLYGRVVASDKVSYDSEDIPVFNFQTKNQAQGVYFLNIKNYFFNKTFIVSISK